MSKQIRANCKKVLLSLIVGAGTIGAMTPVTYLNAATAAQAATTGQQSVKIKDTTVTINSIVDDAEYNMAVANITLDRANGIAKGANLVAIKGKGTVKIDGKDYNINLDSMENLVRVSDKQVQVKVPLTVTTGTKDSEKYVRDFKASQLKGKAITFTIDSVEYRQEKTTMSDQLKKFLTNVPKVQGVTAKEAGAPSFVKSKVLPNKGLNIPLAQGDQSITVDNMGFVDGKLQVIFARTEGAIGRIDIIDSKGNNVIGSSFDIGKNDIEVYDSIKDAAALKKCKVEVVVYAPVANDKETQTFTYTC